MSPLALLAAVAISASGLEIDTFAPHPVHGLDQSGPYQGMLLIAPDAGFRLERGALERRGRARWEGSALLLEEEGGSARRYERDPKRRGYWTWREGGLFETLELAPHENAAGALRRALATRSPRRLLTGNHDLIDPDPQRLILRSAQPSPDDLDAMLAARGLRGVLSLNGELNVRAARRGPSPDEPVEIVRLDEYIASLGLSHARFRLSAGRVPTPDELVGIFRVLLDDARKPLLVHCRGGADRTGLIAALYRVEFLGISKERAKEEMRRGLWLGYDGTEVLGSYFDLYQPGELRRLLERAGVPIPARFN